jgi:hypothetical protein
MWGRERAHNKSPRAARKALGCAATQYIQLVPKRDYLSFERTFRPEEVQEDPPEQIEKLEHPAFIARFGRSDQREGICGRWDIGAGPLSGVGAAGGGRKRSLRLLAPGPCL